MLRRVPSSPIQGSGIGALQAEATPTEAEAEAAAAAASKSVYLALHSGPKCGSAYDAVANDLRQRLGMNYSHPNNMTMSAAAEEASGAASSVEGSALHWANHMPPAQQELEVPASGSVGASSATELGLLVTSSAVLLSMANVPQRAKIEGEGSEEEDEDDAVMVKRFVAAVHALARCDDIAGAAYELYLHENDDFSFNEKIDLIKTIIIQLKGADAALSEDADAILGLLTTLRLSFEACAVQSDLFQQTATLYASLYVRARAQLPDLGLPWEEMAYTGEENTAIAAIAANRSAGIVLRDALLQQITDPAVQAEISEYFERKVRWELIGCSQDRSEHEGGSRPRSMLLNVHVIGGHMMDACGVKPHCSSVHPHASAHRLSLHSLSLRSTRDGEHADRASRGGPRVPHGRGAG